MRPFCTVLIDTYNHERYIERAIVSVMEQDFPASDLEILVVDDGSTDRTPDIVRMFAPRVRLLQKKNNGQASAFNAAFPKCRGQVISFLDGDDWFLPRKIAAVAQALCSEPIASGVGHGYYQFQETSGETQIHAVDRDSFVKITNLESVREVFHAWWGRILNSAFSIRREALERVVPIDESLTFCADSPIALTGMALGATLLKEPLAYYRVHSSNLHAFEAGDSERLRQKYQMSERMFQVLDRQLRAVGVSSQLIAALLDALWADASRCRLRACGGKRIETFQTEMRAFRSESTSPSFGNSLFKYGVVAPASLLLSPEQFYTARDWYARHRIGRIRERICGKNNPFPGKI